MDFRVITSTIASAILALMMAAPSTPNDSGSIRVDHKNMAAKSTVAPDTSDLDDAVAELESLIAKYEATRSDDAESLDEIKTDIRSLMKEQVKLGSFKPGASSPGLSSQEVRSIVREELDRKLDMKTEEGDDLNLLEFLSYAADMKAKQATANEGKSGNSKKEVTTGIETSTVKLPNASAVNTDPIIAVDGRPVYAAYGSTGNPIAQQSQSYAYGSISSSGYSGASYGSGGSGGGYQTVSTPVRSILQSARQSSKPRYFVNAYGCTVDRTTGKVISCSAR